MNKDDVFRGIVDILSGLLIEEWWCDAGTCLAIERNGDFIAQTDDVDIGIYSEQIPKMDELIHRFQLSGFTLSKVRSYKGLIMTIGFTGPEKVDLFFYHEKGDYLWHTICGWEDERKLRKVFKPEKFTRDLFMTLKGVQFKDRTVLLPNPPVAYLIERYGMNWGEPNPDYKFWRDSQAIDMEFA